LAKLLKIVLPSQDCLHRNHDHLFHVSREGQALKLFDSLRSRSQPLEIIDPVLGRLRYQDVGFWEGEILFGPIGRKIEFTVEADKNGPETSQHEFYRRLESHYPDLLKSVEFMLIKEWSSWMGKSFKGDIWEDFDLDGFGIPRTSSAQMEWELMFYSESAQHSFSIIMEAWVPKKVRIDG
jgi:hypothetical protein